MRAFNTTMRQHANVAFKVTRSAAVVPSRHMVQQRRGPAPAKGVHFSDEFMSVLSKSLEREESRIAEKIGLPGLHLHEMVEEEDIEGTGTLIWAAGVRLSQHIVKNRTQELKGARVLDLGSGTGIVGIAAACLGAHVMLTDTRDILPQIMENVHQNGALVEAAGGSATVQELDWNQPDDEVLDQDYDWVFGSDVTYTEEALLPLAKLLRQLVLTNEQCVVKLAHMHRSKELDRAMRETFHDEGLMLRPVDCRTTGTTKYEDPLHVDEAIAFYRVTLDPALRELGGN
ncbi:putative methyltransferase-domain-containing protein [Scenedesmus sp. NREL 46B-D3]|nr:putative methyltransferase-domain-containing protein [Scenedesmus sp. NREL 46B-D3]